MKEFICMISIFLSASFSMAQDKDIEKVLKRMNNKSVPYIYPNDVQLNDNILLLDAREPDEYAVSKIPGAVYVGYKKFDINTIKGLNIPKNKKVIVYCSLGVRSEKIGNKIKKAGYNNVFNLWGGIFEWKNEGKTVVDSNNKPTENVHAYSKMWGKYLNKGNKVY